VEALGQCDAVYVKEIGDTQLVCFDKHGETGKIATIIIRGSSQAVRVFTIIK
jgi:chaperonin GroEL (HSP60 family)